jgi:hypothetical protein
MNRIYKSTFLFGYSLWGGLGAYRGVQDYNKEFNKKNNNYLIRPKYATKPQYYYLSCFGNSIVWCIVYYLNPIFIPISLIKELYNIERAIRGIEEEE